jgi:hypothetical protein
MNPEAGQAAQTSHEPEIDGHAVEHALRVLARRNRLFGLWAAERLGLTPVEAEAYATRTVQAEFEEPGDLDVVRMILGDLVALGVETSEIELRAALEAADGDARRQIGS